jgi:CubicO group peptidase (beta-lactamase class C family)
VTIDQALRMSSGVAFNEVYSEGTSDVASFMRSSVIEQRESADVLAAAFPRAAPAGSIFNYSTAETQILGLLLRSVTGSSHAAYLEEKLWRPLGMEHDATIVLDRPGPAGVEMAGCCLNAALRDWARFGQLYLQDGVWRGQRILPEGWVARATSARDAPERDSPSTEAHYRYQWWLFDADRFAAEGVYGQFIFVDPAHQLVVAKASFWPTAWDDALAVEAVEVYGALGRHLAGEASP